VRKSVEESLQEWAEEPAEEWVEKPAEEWVEVEERPFRAASAAFLSTGL
jgi:hypothetical protein